jgi:hypothetical protein
VRIVLSCAASAERMVSASDSHRRVEPSMSVNRNVTTPDGADTQAESHTFLREQTQRSRFHGVLRCFGVFSPE